MFAATNMMFTGRAFNPLSLSPALWLDASDAATLYNGASPAAADDPISEWRDKSGNARHGTQSTGISQPLRKTAVQNGRDVVRFDGSNDFLFAPDFHQSNISIFAIYNPANNENIQHVLRKGFGFASAEFLIRAGSSTAAVFAASNGTINPSASASKTAGAWILQTGIYDGSNVRSSVNGGSESISAMTGNIFNGSFRLRIGSSYASESDAASPSATLQGDIAELLIFPTAVSDADRLVVQQYLNAKWGIY